MHVAGVKCTDPYLGMILKADEADLIADELFRVSVAYQNGYAGLPVKSKLAQEYCRKSAERGHAMAQFYMVRLLMQSPNDSRPEVMQWLEAAAEQGVPQALFNLGISYHRGDQGKLDTDMSYKLIRKSAERDYGPACARLAVIHLEGHDNQLKDYRIAKFWAMHGAALHDNGAMQVVAQLLSDSERDVQKLDVDKIIDEAMLAGEPLAYVLYAQNLSKTDLQNAIKVLEDANLANCSRAEEMLGTLYWRSEQYEKAMTHLLIAANDGLGDAQCLLANILYEGKGGKKNIEEALKWVEKSLNLGNKGARALFAHMIMSNDLQTLLPDTVMRGGSYFELAGLSS
jgi:TPR repeat protein